MTTARQEKPSVPTPDAAEVSPAVENARRLLASGMPAGKPREAIRELLAAYCGTGPQLRELDYLRRHLLEIDDIREDFDHVPNPDPAKQRMRDEQDALLAGMQAAREPYGPFTGGEMDEDTRTAGLLADVCDAAFNDESRAEQHGYAGILERVQELVKHDIHCAPRARTPAPASVEAASLPEPWEGRAGWNLDDDYRVYAPHANGGAELAACAEANGEWTAYRHNSSRVLTQGFTAEGPSRQHRARLAAWNALCAASQYGLTPADAVGGTLPAAAAGADVHGLGEGWIRCRDLGVVDESWDYGVESDTYIIRDQPNGRWSAVRNLKTVGYTDTPQEAARLALGTAPAVVRGDGAGAETSPLDPERYACDVCHQRTNTMRVICTECDPSMGSGERSPVSWPLVYDAAREELGSDPEPGRFGIAVAMAIEAGLRAYHGRVNGGE